MKTSALLGAFAILVAISPHAEAGFLGSLLSFDGTEDPINDNSRSVILDLDDDGADADHFSVGDEIVGVLKLEAIDGNDPDNFGGLAFGIFSLRIAGVTPMTVGPVTTAVLDHGAAAVNTLESLLGGIAPSSYSFTGDEFFAVVTSTTASDPFSADPGNSTPLMTIISALTTPAWTVDLIGEFDGVDDFFQAQVNPLAPFSLGNSDGDLTISEVRSDTGGMTVLTERAAFTVAYDTFGSGTQYLPLTTTDFFSTSATGDILLTPDGSVQTTSGTGADVVDDANFLVNPVPEPSSLILFGAGMIGLVSSRYRKRKIADSLMS